MKWWLCLIFLSPLVQAGEIAEFRSTKELGRVLEKQTPNFKMALEYLCPDFWDKRSDLTGSLKAKSLRRCAHLFNEEDYSQANLSLKEICIQNCQQSLGKHTETTKNTEAAQAMAKCAAEKCQSECEMEYETSRARLEGYREGFKRGDSLQQ